MNEFFKINYPFCSNYFETVFKYKKRFPQSIVFEGLDILSQYFFTLELLRILNCKTDEKNCTCTSCKWIKEDAHPAIINVTPLDFKEDASKTVISVKQIEKITSMISESSDYHRFFIFSNAKIQPLDEIKQNKLNIFKNAGYSLSKEDWYPYPLNRKIMQEEASNALLKSTEEAPDNTTFVFLTNTREDIIQTIASRSLIFKLPAKKEKNLMDFSYFFENYPNIEIQSAMESSGAFLEKISKEEIDIIDALNSIQELLVSYLKNNFSNTEFITQDIKRIQLAKRQVLANVSVKYVLEGLFLDLSNEGRKNCKTEKL